MAPVTVHYADGPVTLHHDDCLVALRGMSDESVHAVVTDPPYGLANTDPSHVIEALTKWAAGDREFIPEGRGFMGKAWDAFVPPPAVWDECLRVLKPGGHLLAFAGSRTFDLMALSIRFAGFDIRDSIAWLYGSGFPKSLDVSKRIEKMQRGQRVVALIDALIADGATLAELGTRSDIPSLESSYRDWTERGVNPEERSWDRLLTGLDLPEEAGLAIIERRMLTMGGGSTYSFREGEARDWEQKRAALTTDLARTWQGWGTALKPAFEPIVMARKPFGPPVGGLAVTVAANVLAHGTGALNIDATRIATDTPIGRTNHTTSKFIDSANGTREAHARTVTVDNSGGLGRWPANVILDGSQAAELDRQAPNTGGSGKASGPTLTGGSTSVARGAFGGVDSTPFYGGDLGGASRFFYVAKAPTSERPEVEGTMHATVKPLDLMQRLIRLVTPPGGIVLEPFAGSGTTLEAAVREGFGVIGIEREAEYLPLILQRIRKPHEQPLFGDDL